MGRSLVAKDKWHLDMTEQSVVGDPHTHDPIVPKSTNRIYRLIICLWSLAQGLAMVVGVGGGRCRPRPFPGVPSNFDPLVVPPCCTTLKPEEAKVDPLALLFMLSILPPLR